MPILSGKYVPEDAIAQSYKQADSLSNQRWAPNIYGNIAAGIGAVGGNLIRGSANNALTGNQDMRSGALRDAAAAPDNASMAKILMERGVPGLDETGFKMLAADRQSEADANKPYRIRAAQALQYGFQKGTPEFNNFVLTGDMPKARDPLDDEYKRAQIGKLNKEIEGGAAKFGKTGAIVQGADGRYYSVQFAEDGTKKIDPLAVGETALTPSRGVSEVDTGTGTQIIDKATGLPVRSVEKDLAGAERDKIVGRETGERQMALPKAQASLESANAKTQLVRSKIAQALPMVNNYTAGVGSLLSALPGTQARDLRETIDTIIANLGFEELQDMRNNSPTGGALGAIAVQELAMLQKTKTSLEQAQTVGQLQAALRELDQFQTGASERRQKAFANTYAPQQSAPQPQQGGAPQAPAAPRPRAVNPQTGQTIEFDGQQWIEVR